MGYRYSEGELMKKFLEQAYREFLWSTDVDVVVVGAGPAGLTTAWKIAEKQKKVLVLERMLGVGGGIRGGGMLLPVALVQEEAIHILNEANVSLTKLGEGIYSVNPTEAMVKLAQKAIESGAKIFVGIEVEDLIARRKEGKVKVEGVVINWTPIVEAHWHVDPIMFQSKAVVDATGHDAKLLQILKKRFPELSINIPGMSSMDVWEGEKMVIEKTGMVVDGLFLAGMSVAEYYNTPRMGPILGGMLLSGEKSAKQILDYIK